MDANRDAGPTSTSALTEDPRWSVYMKVPIPECASIRDEVVNSSRIAEELIDKPTLLDAVEKAAWDCLADLTEGRDDVTWEVLRALREHPAFDHRMLAIFLSTQGAVGVAVYDKLMSHLAYAVPVTLLGMVDAGKFANP